MMVAASVKYAETAYAAMTKIAPAKNATDVKNARSAEYVAVAMSPEPEANAPV